MSTAGPLLTVLRQLHAEEQELADDLAKRRAAALILRQRLRIALFELKPQAASQGSPPQLSAFGRKRKKKKKNQRLPNPTADSQQKLCEVFLSTSIARSMPPKVCSWSRNPRRVSIAPPQKTYESQGKQLGADAYAQQRSEPANLVSAAMS